jgi:hypothetical protein
VIRDPRSGYASSVGTLYSGHRPVPIGIEDRALAHLKLAITTKLRRGESFTLSWTHPEGQARGRSSIWLNPAMPLRFVFDEPEARELDRDWIEELMRSANSSGGITLGVEHMDSSVHEPVAQPAVQPVAEPVLRPVAAA